MKTVPLKRGIRRMALPLFLAEGYVQTYIDTRPTSLSLIPVGKKAIETVLLKFKNGRVCDLRKLTFMELTEMLPNTKERDWILNYVALFENHRTTPSAKTKSEIS